MQRCFEEQKYLSENGMQALPLIVKAGNSTPVSYTHLDVYKRQVLSRAVRYTI